MEWSTLQHLDLRHIGRGVRPLQPHAASFHPHQALVAVAIGTYIVGERITSFSFFFNLLCFRFSEFSSLCYANYANLKFDYGN